MLDRCWDGRLPARGVEVDESAGSSGTPYQWVRSADELAQVHRTLELLAGYVLDHAPGAEPDRQLITVNAFSMGAWSTGVNVSAALKRMGVLKSCGPDVEKILAVLAGCSGQDRATRCAATRPSWRPWPTRRLGPAWTCGRTTSPGSSVARG